MLTIAPLYPLRVLGGLNQNSPPNCLAFTNVGNTEGGVSFFKTNSKLILYGSLNNKPFENITTLIEAGVTLNPGDNVRLYGDTTDYTQPIGRFFIYGSEIEASGSIMNICSHIFAGCFKNMFNMGSFENTLIKAPELPATELAPNCYESMFESCNYLTKAPELPAVALVSNCYRQMFYGCSGLNEVKIACDNIRTGYGAANSYNWLYGVKSTGLFIKPAALIIARNTSCIPTGWTIQDY